MSGFSLDGHTLRLAGGRPGSEDVRFEFHEDEGVVWVKYRGGPLGAGVRVREEVAFDSRASDSPATLEEIGS